VITGENADYLRLLSTRALSAYDMGVKSPGVCQTAPGRAPYFYEEDNWTDDMELAAASVNNMNRADKQYCQYCSI
jgi:endoglucanase